MRTIPISKARAKLGRLFNEVVALRYPIRLTSRNSSAVLVSEDDWRAIAESLHRLSDSRFGKPRRRPTLIPIHGAPKTPSSPRG
jgi:prevent-host-death family protein